MGQWNPGLDRPFSVAGAPGLAVACEGFDIAGRELKLDFHMPVALSRLASHVKLNEPSRLAVHTEVGACTGFRNRLLRSGSILLAGPLGLRLQSVRLMHGLLEALDRLADSFPQLRQFSSTKR